MEFPGSPFVQRRMVVSKDSIVSHDGFPWDWYIYLHEWSTFMENVGTVHIPHMDPMGFSKGLVHQKFRR